MNSLLICGKICPVCCMENCWKIKKCCFSIETFQRALKCWTKNLFHLGGRFLDFCIFKPFFVFVEYSQILYSNWTHPLKLLVSWTRFSLEFIDTVEVLYSLFSTAASIDSFSRVSLTTFRNLPSSGLSSAEKESSFSY